MNPRYLGADDTNGPDGRSSLNSSGSLSSDQYISSLQPPTFPISAAPGHSYHQGSISGGQVQFGDVYHITYDNDGAYGSASQARGTDAKRGSHCVFAVPRCSSTYFTGRALQLAQARQKLDCTTSGHQSRQILVVSGQGGSGKTQFCLRYAELFQENYYGVFWIDASSRRTIENGYAELGRLFGKGPTPAAGRFWIAEFGHPWLLVMDNADDPDLDITSLLPAGSTGHIMITTRNPRLGTFGTVGTLRLTEMDPQEAIELLLRSAYPDDYAARTQNDHKTVANEIAQRLGYLAIAIRQAGSTIQRKIYTIERYLRSYLGHRSRLLGAQFSVKPEEVEVITTWEIPFKRIESRQTESYQDAVALLHIFAFLHWEAIPESLLRAPWAQLDRSSQLAEQLPGILQLAVRDKDDASARLRRALGILYDYSIIEFDPEGAICSLHPVVHAWARSRIKDEQTVKRWLKCTLFVLSCSAIEHIDDDCASSVISLLPHIDGFLDLSLQFDPRLHHSAAGAHQLEAVAMIYERGGRWFSSLTVLQSVLEYRMVACGQHHQDTLRVKRRLSLCHWNLFQVGEAIQLQNEIRHARWLFRPSMLDWMHPIRPTHTEYLLTLSDLTQTLWLAGQRRLSRFVGERAVNGLCSNLGPFHSYTLDASFHLGRTYRHLGLLEQAHTLLVLVLKERSKSLGSEHVDTLMAKNEVAMSLCSRKTNLALAEKWLRQVLSERGRILGEEHAYTLWSVNDLAKLLSVRNRPAEAVANLEKIVPAVIRTLGERHVGMQMTKGNLARAYAQMHRWVDAEKTLEEIIPMIDKAHPDWANSMIGCARVHIRLDKLDQAEQKCLSFLSTTQPGADRAESYATSRIFGVLNILPWLVPGENDTSESSQQLNAAAGVLAEVYRREGERLKLTQLLQDYPDLDEHIMDRPFEMT